MSQYPIKGWFFTNGGFRINQFIKLSHGLNYKKIAEKKY